jgi:hypothetical protein
MLDRLAIVVVSLDNLELRAVQIQNLYGSGWDCGRTGAQEKILRFVVQDCILLSSSDVSSGAGPEGGKRE